MPAWIACSLLMARIICRIGCLPSIHISFSKGVFVMELKFYRCKHCGNIVVKLEDSGVPVSCCGEAMEQLQAGVSDGAHEKHVPVVEHKDGIVKVRVGSVEHPMMPAHYIQWIVLETESGCQMKHLKPGAKPEAEFVLSDNSKVLAVYEYCNLHGLWKA